MRVSTALATFFLSFSLASPSASHGGPGGPDRDIQPDVYEAIHQRESILALTLDTKDWAHLGDSVTKDVVYDSRPLGPDYGGLSVGLEQLIQNSKAAFGNARVGHHVSNAVIKLNRDATQANVTTYIVYSRWDLSAPHDVKKSFRIFERCDDVFVVDDGTWKLKHSLVTNLAPGAEALNLDAGRKHN